MPFAHVYTCLSDFGGLEVACWLLVPKFAGSNSAEAVGFLRAKKKFSRNYENALTLRLLMSYIYGAPILDVSRSHTTTQHSR